MPIWAIDIDGLEPGAATTNTTVVRPTLRRGGYAEVRSGTTRGVKITPNGRFNSRNPSALELPITINRQGEGLRAPNGPTYLSSEGTATNLYNDPENEVHAYMNDVVLPNIKEASQTEVERDNKDDYII